MIMKMRDLMKKKNGQKGFTLVELIVVMAILAVLAAIAVPRYTDMLSDAKTKADTANQQLIKKAAELYYANEGTDVTAITDLIPKYLDANPDDPTTADVEAGYTVTTTGGVATVGRVED